MWRLCVWLNIQLSTEQGCSGEFFLWGAPFSHPFPFPSPSPFFLHLSFPSLIPPSLDPSPSRPLKVGPALTVQLGIWGAGGAQTPGQKNFCAFPCSKLYLVTGGSNVTFLIYSTNTIAGAVFFSIFICSLSMRMAIWYHKDQSHSSIWVVDCSLHIYCTCSERDFRYFMVCRFRCFNRSLYGNFFSSIISLVALFWSSWVGSWKMDPLTTLGQHTELP